MTKTSWRNEKHYPRKFWSINITRGKLMVNSPHSTNSPLARIETFLERFSCCSASQPHLFCAYSSEVWRREPNLLNVNLSELRVPRT